MLRLTKREAVNLAWAGKEAQRSVAKKRTRKLTVADYLPLADYSGGMSWTVRLTDADRVKFETLKQPVHLCHLAIEPQPAVRTTAQGKHAPRAQRYHAYCNDLRFLWKQARYHEQLLDAQLFQQYATGVVFRMVPPKSGGRAMAQQLLGKLCAMRADFDNFAKGFVDALLEQDRGVCDMRVQKRWATAYGIDVYLLPEWVP